MFGTKDTPDSIKSHHARPVNTRKERMSARIRPRLPQGRRVGAPQSSSRARSASVSSVGHESSLSHPPAPSLPAASAAAAASSVTGVGDSQEGAQTSDTGSSVRDSAIVPAPIVRPTAITRHGVRQFVETSHGVRLFLQNCVATVTFGGEPDLAHIATHARNVEYNPKRFSAAIVRLREPKATALVFSSGKMVVTGAKNEDDAHLAARKFTRMIQRLGFSAEFSEFKIRNIVGTGDCGFPIRLEGIADEHGRFSSYEPELFSGLVYRMERPHIVVLIFVSGKVVVTGAQSRSDIVNGFSKLYPVILKYRKPVHEPESSAAAASSSRGGRGPAASALAEAHSFPMGSSRSGQASAQASRLHAQPRPRRERSSSVATEDAPATKRARRADEDGPTRGRPILPPTYRNRP